MDLQYNVDGEPFLCDDEKTKEVKRFCGPSERTWLTKLIPQFFPCACRIHDIKYYNLTLRQAIKVNDEFLLNMLHTVKKTKKNIFSKAQYSILALVFYYAVMLAMPVYLYKWRKNKK